MPPTSSRARWRDRLHQIIFEADTPAGRAFDLVLLVLIVVSIAAVLAESIQSVRRAHGDVLRVVEWVLTIAFTLEYVLRLACVAHPARYARSFFGVVDLLAIIPTYVSGLVPGAQSLLVIRALRLLRVFRVLKVAAYLREANSLMASLVHSLRKIALFLGVILVLVLILGSMMYVVEGEASGFTSIPRSIYWAIVTMTTVGYGDIAPRTEIGQFIASIVMLTGYGILAVPTGIVTAQIVMDQRSVTTRTCAHCLTEGHDARAAYCSDCGAPLLGAAGQSAGT
ncbi:MAG: ion transporter [Kofleriaceae bacterium]